MQGGQICHPRPLMTALTEEKKSRDSEINSRDRGNLIQINGGKTAHPPSLGIGGARRGRGLATSRT